MLRVSLVGKNSGKEISAYALVDSGVEGMIINDAFAKKNKLSLQQLRNPFPYETLTDQVTNQKLLSPLLFRQYASGCPETITTKNNRNSMSQTSNNTTLSSAPIG